MAQQQQVLTEGPGKGFTKPITNSGTSGDVVMNTAQSNNELIGHGLRDGAQGESFSGQIPGETVVKKPRGIYIEGLGDLADNELDVPEEDESEGEGDFAVVLVDLLTGAGGVSYTKGDVRRMSKFVNGFSDKSKVTVARSEARRLFDLNSIRFVSEEEKGHKKIVIEARQETSEVQLERERRIRAERENNRLREQLANAMMAQEAASPNPIHGPGKSDTDEPNF